MNDTKDKALMIGLHKLAALRGDGLIPELLALYGAMERATDMPHQHFEGSEAGAALSTAKAVNDNVISIGPYLRARRKR